jgi:hypothetical protein
VRAEEGEWEDEGEGKTVNSVRCHQYDSKMRGSVHGTACQVACYNFYECYRRMSGCTEMYCDETTNA